LLYVEADSSGADSWKLDSVVDLLKQGAVGVIPTDTVYVVLLRFMSMLHQLSFLSIFKRVYF
jgi:tRNA A37 threonylcarbamoyladenosine synthetase subunit TsaC/SUA5/YrdC